MSGGQSSFASTERPPHEGRNEREAGNPEVLVSGEGTQLPPASDLPAAFKASDLPKYVSHKEVHAARIRRWETIPAEGQRPAHLVIFLEGFESPLMNVDPKLFARYVPVPGDYFVVYADGYQSISPRKAFEEGYTLAVNNDA